MADLSDTLAVMPKTPTEAQMETLLNTVGAIGGQTGFPAINLTITDDSAQIADKDADLLIIGAIPGKLKDDKRIDLLVQATQSWVKTPMRQTAFRRLCRMRPIARRMRSPPSPPAADGGSGGLPVAV